ncbi:hypothetical protein KFK09_027288 [Dendrobium nobile]|uniref:Uncharacterized protein n=1 Tax=Dendrobium nobile TaxID=94219 RepID=A0A8T3AB57_DENNO|nr:hypothetical protein KFK09_027288 [Dendrobium nobile]
MEFTFKNLAAESTKRRKQSINCRPTNQGIKFIQRNNHYKKGYNEDTSPAINLHKHIFR